MPVSSLQRSWSDITPTIQKTILDQSEPRNQAVIGLIIAAQNIP